MGFDAGYLVRQSVPLPGEGVLCSLVLNFVEKYETANWSLRQGDEEVNKRIKQKCIYLNKLPNISVWKQTFLRG